MLRDGSLYSGAWNDLSYSIMPSLISGGPGYALSHAALRKYLGYIDNDAECYANEATHMEDINIG